MHSTHTYFWWFQSSSKSNVLCVPSDCKLKSNVKECETAKVIACGWDAISRYFQMFGYEKKVNKILGVMRYIFKWENRQSGLGRNVSDASTNDKIRWAIEWRFLFDDFAFSVFNSIIKMTRDPVQSTTVENTISAINNIQRVYNTFFLHLLFRLCQPIAWIQVRKLWRTSPKTLFNWMIQKGAVAGWWLHSSCNV